MHAREWYGGATMDQALQYARHGWAAGTAQAGALVTRLADRLVSATAPTQATVIGMDVMGAALDTAAYVAGVPEAWGTLQADDTKKAVHVVVNCSASGGVPASALMSRGVAVAAIVLVLQERGYPITLDVMLSHFEKRDRKVRYMLNVRILDAETGSQVDVDRVVFAVAHPAMYRHLLRAEQDNIQRGTTDDPPRWGPSDVLNRPMPDTTPDLYIGSTHLDQVERWRDGGEAWVLAEYERLTEAA